MWIGSKTFNFSIHLAHAIWNVYTSGEKYYRICTVLMNDYFCRKDTMVKLYIKTIFLKDNLIVVLKSLFTRIYWCFVINYRFKIVQIVTLGPMNWPLDQYLTFGPMTSIPDLWTNGVTLEPTAWPSEQWPVVSTDSGAVGKAQISTLCFRF